MIVSGKIKYMKKKVQDYIAVFQEEKDGTYSVWIPELPGCASQGETFEEALANIKEAIELCMEVKKEESDNEFVGVQTIEVSL